jgi:crotonobetainyl-CoA:carnitine CoA-transferase CaiB-like acyl-CoA transferase
MTPGQLDGLRVLDLTIWRPGPYTTQLLAEHGADVLKVEPPGGDPMRSMPDLFDILGAGKRSIILDLKRDDHQRQCLELAADADVFVESYRPGVADRLGVGYEAVAERNPAIVYCSVSGFGALGPLARVPGHDINYLAYSAVLRPRGGEPRTPTIPISDLAGGVAAAFAIAVACFGAQRTGRGERIDISVSDVLASWVGPVGQVQMVGVDRALNGIPGYGVFPTADDRHVALGIMN